MTYLWLHNYSYQRLTCFHNTDSYELNISTFAWITRSLGRIRGSRCSNFFNCKRYTIIWKANTVLGVYNMPRSIAQSHLLAVRQDWPKVAGCVIVIKHWYTVQPQAKQSVEAWNILCMALEVEQIRNYVRLKR